MISVITICKNAENIIGETVSSIFQQKDETFEFLLIDGDSTDSTINTVKSLIEKYKFPANRVIIISEKDEGVYDAMNKGINNAHGDFILFMNGGDKFYNENVISNFEKIIEKTSADAYYGNTLMEFYEGKGILHDNEEINRNPIMPFIHQSVIVKKSLLEYHPFNLKYKILADYDFFYWMRMTGCKFHYEPFIVSIYDAKEGLSENNPLIIAFERDEILGVDKRKHYWIRKIVLHCTVGLIQPIKNIAPCFLLNFYFRKKKSYIKWLD